MKDILSQNIIVGQIDNSIYEIATLMKENDIGFVPIVKQNKIVGVVTDRDIVVEAVSNCANTNTKVENYMTRHIITIDISKTIDDVLDLMASFQIKRVLVLENEKVIGIISICDILKVYHNYPKLVETLKRIYIIESKKKTPTTEIDQFYL